MGNSSSEIVSRVEGLDLDALSKSMKQDLEILGDPSLIFNTGKLLCRSDLEDYMVPGFDKVKPKEEDVSTEQEESMIYSVDIAERHHEKHGDAIKNLIDDILRKKGEDPCSKEIIVKLQAISRIFEALMRLEQTRKLRSKHEETKLTATKGALPPVAKAAVRFGLGTLLYLVKCVGGINPEIYQLVAREASETLAEMPPMALQTSDPTISKSLDNIATFFDSIMKGEVDNVTEEDKLASLSPLFALAITTGSLTSTLVLALRFLLMPHNDNLRPTLEIIYPHLKSLKNLGVAVREDVPKWCKTKVGPNSSLADDDCSVSGSSGWSSTLGNEEITSGVHYYEMVMETLSTENFLWGVADTKYTSMSSWSDSNFSSFLYQCQSSIWNRSNEIYKWEAYKQGDRIGMLLNMDDKTVTFYKNGIREPRGNHGPLPDCVRLYTTQAGTTKVKNIVPESLPEDAINVLGSDKPIDTDEFKAMKLYQLLEGDSPSEEFFNTSTAEISSFILSKLACVNIPTLELLQSKGKKIMIPKKRGISLDLQYLTVDQLDNIFVALLNIIKTGEFNRLSQESCHLALISTQQLIRAHLLASRHHQNHGLDSLLRNRVMEHTTEILTILPNTKASEEATLTISLCFDCFYSEPQEKLSYLIERLEDKKSGKEIEGVFKQLQDRIFLEMAQPEKLFPALQLVNDDHSKVIQHYFELLIEFGTKTSTSVVHGEAPETGLIRLLETSQTVLIAQAAKSNFEGTWQEILLSYAVTLFQNADGVIKEILALYPNGDIPDDLCSKMNDTILQHLLEGLLYSLMLSKMDLSILAKVLSSLQGLILSLGRFLPKPSVLTTGSAWIPQIYESTHNYADGLNTEYLVKVPRALKYLLTFDPQCKTENGCDYLELWLDQNRSSKFARWEGENFPKQPVEVQNPLLFFTFHSDGSVNYWGWKIEIKAEVEASYFTKQWPDTTKDAASTLLGYISSNLISGQWDLTPDDEEASQLLNNPLLKYGIHDSVLTLVKEPAPLNEHLFMMVTNATMTERAKKAITASVYSEAIKKRIVKSTSTTVSLGDYAFGYGKHETQTKYSSVPFLQELIEGSERVTSAWANLKRKSGVIGPTANIGGAEMDQAERAIFAVYTAFFEAVDTVNKIFDAPSDIGATMKYIIKQSSLIRGWAQKQKQKLMDGGKPDITYSDINKDIVTKCALLLGTDYKLSLNELGVSKVMKNLLSNVARIQSQDSGTLKSGSKWKTVKAAVKSASKLKGLLNLASKTKEPENEDVKEFLKVADLTTKFLESSVPVETIINVIDKRRTKGIARTLGFLSFANLIGASNKQESALVKSFSDSLKIKSEKNHYWVGLEGIDPTLLHCVQHSFFQVYATLQKELSKPRPKKLKQTDYNHYLTVLEAMSCPLKGTDGHLILEQQFPTTITHLLKWAKGKIGEDEIHRPFKKELCITRFGVLPEADVPENATKVLLEERPDEPKIYLVIDKAGNAKPITEAVLSSERNLEGYEDACGEFTLRGETKFIFIKRDDEKPNNKYLTGVSDTLEFTFTEYDSLIDAEPEEERKKREELRTRLSKGSWALFKQLLYSIAGSWIETNETKKLLIQELFIQAIFNELKYNKVYTTPDETPLVVAQLARGDNWIGKNVIPAELNKNPVQEWLRQFRHETEKFSNFALKEIINEFIEKADPAMKGILTTDDLSKLERPIAETLESYEENKNNRGEYDFFRYLHVLKGLNDQFPSDVQEYMNTSKLWQELPYDYYEAAAAYDLTNVNGVIDNFDRKLKPTEGASFKTYIELFRTAEQPGILAADKIPENTPAEFKDEDGLLDFYVTVNAINRNHEKFASFYNEIQDSLSFYGDLPHSCKTASQVIAGQIDYLGSLLWSLYGSLGSQCLPKLLARESYFNTLLQLTFAVPSSKIVTFGARILRHVISTQHSPQTLAPYWDSLQGLTDTKVDLITYLLSKIGKGVTWYEHENLKEISLRWAYEAESLLLSLSQVDRWRVELVETLIQTIQDGKAIISQNKPLEARHTGAIYLLSASSKNYDGYGIVPITLSQARLSNSSIPRGVIREINHPNANFYSVNEDSLATEPLEKIEGLEAQINTRIYDHLTVEEKDSLSEAIVSFWENLQDSRENLIFAPSETIANVRILYAKLDVAFMVAILDILESKESVQESEGESIIRRILDRSKPYTFTSKNVYSKIVNELAKKLHANPQAKEEVQMTEQEAQAKIATYAEADQLLATELLSLDVPAVKIVKCFDQGIKERDAVISWQEPVKPEKQIVQLYKLGALDDNTFKARDLAGKSELYQNGLYHFVINNPENTADRKELMNTLDNSIFHEVNSQCSMVTILAVLEGKAKNDSIVGGLKIGKLKVGWKAEAGSSHFTINKATQHDFSHSEQLFVRIHASSSGEITVINEISHERREFTTGGVFNGFKISDYGVYLKQGASISLLAFEIYEGKYEGGLQAKIEKAKDLEGGERYVRIKTKPQNLDRLRLKLLGLSDEEITQLLSSNDSLSSIVQQTFTSISDSTNLATSSLTLEEATITDVKIFKSKDLIPKDYSVVQVYENGSPIEFEMANRQWLAFKKENFLTGKCCTGFSVAENPGDYTDVGDLSVEDERKNNVYVKITAPDKKNIPIKDIAFIKVSSIYSVVLPHGFRLVTDKEGKAINIAGKQEKGHYILVGIKDSDTIMNCNVFPLRNLTVKGNAFGLTDQFQTSEVKVNKKEEEKSYEGYTIMELYNYLNDIEENRRISTSRKLLVTVLKKNPNIIIQASNSLNLGKLLSFVDTELDLLEGPLTQLLSSLDKQDFRVKAATECITILMSCLIAKTSSVALKTITIESLHPYNDGMDVDDVITIPGAKGLRIEFDPQCYTESGCDPLRFYSGSGRQGELKTLSGQGESNWQPFDIEGDTVYTYFHSDGSVHYWGYKFDVIPIGSGEKPEMKPDVALWLLEKFSQLVDTEKELDLLYSTRCLQTIFLFMLSSCDIETKSRSLNILKSFMKHSTPTLQSIFKILFSEANELYNTNKSTKLGHPLLQTLVLLLVKAVNLGYSGPQESWFIELSELISDMKGLTDKDEALEMFIFETFKGKINANAEQVRESVHPYNRKTKCERIQIPGAAFLNIEFDSQSKVEPRDTIFFSYDEEGKSSIEKTVIGVESASSNWADLPKGPDIALSNNNKTVTRTNSSGWGTAVFNESYSSGKIKISLHIDQDGDSAYLYIGVMKSDGTDYNLSEYIGSDCSREVWTWKKSGEFHKKGSNVSGTGYGTNDTIVMLIDADSKELTFFKNEEEVYKFTGLSQSVIPAICFGGSNQLVSIKSVEKLGFGEATIDKKKLKVNGDTVYSWFPVNSGFNKSHFWLGAKESANRSDGKLTITKLDEGNSMYESNVDLKAGNHYIETTINSEGRIGIGLAMRSSVENKNFEAETNMILYSDTDGFGLHDVIGVHANFDANSFTFYKNGAQIAVKNLNTEFTEESEPLKFVAVLTAPQQAVTLSEKPSIPEHVDLLNITSESDSALWGYKYKVIPEFKGRNMKVIESLLSFATEEIKTEWRDLYSAKFKRLFCTGAAEQLVIYLDEFTQSKGKDVLTLTNEEIDPTESELIYYPELEKLSKDDIRGLYQILLNFNKRVESSLYLFNLHIDPQQGISEVQRVFAGSKSYIFFKIKNTLLKDCISKTNVDVRTEITIDRPKAARHRDRKEVDALGQFSIFGQIYRALISKQNREFRNSERFYRVSYRGEAATDAGGPYNESISNMVDELQSSYLRLLVPCPNNVHNIGENRESWIINPAADSKQDLELYVFLGKLMGAAIRTQNNLGLSFPPMFWKRLLMDPVSIKDLRGVDVCCVQILEILRNLEANQLTPDNFNYAYDVKFTTKDSSGREVDITENGKDIAVTYENAGQYADLVEKYRLAENPKAYEAIRKGMSAVVPIDYLNLFSWKQLEILVCGAANIDIDILKVNTDYSNCSASDQHIVWFWEALTEMIPKERALYLKFVWGRSKLPSGRDWKHMTITRYNPPGPVNNYMPVTHTCFFTIDLPPYTTKEAMKNKLLYAITHCTDIDLDGSASAGWEEDD